MKKDEKKSGMGTALKFIFVLFCTVIGGYGILHAPESDQAQLEQELKRNEQLLEQTMEQVTESDLTQSQKTDKTEKNTDGKTKKPKLPQGIITVIGDSVFLGAAPSFQELVKHAVIDAKVSRQVSQALDVAKKLKKNGKLGNTVIISLGINGNFNSATGQELIDFLGPDRTIYWINAYGEEKDIQQAVNKTIQRLAEQNSNLHVIPWAKEAKKHDDWFYQDGTHLNAKGQKGFAKYIKKEIQN